MMISAEKAIKQKAKAILSRGWTAPVIAIGIILMLVFTAASLEALAQTVAHDYLNFNIEPRIVNNLRENYVIPYLYYLMTELVPLVFILFMLPFFNGYIKLHYSAIKNNGFELSDLVYFFNIKRYWKTLALDLSLFFRLLIPAILFFLPPIIYSGLCIYFFRDFAANPVFTVMLVILDILSGIMLIIYSLKFFLVFKLYGDDDTKKISYYFSFSKEGMDGNYGRIIKLFVSLIPQYLLSLLLLPLVYTAPYITQAYCVSADYLIELQKEKDHYDESFTLYNSIQRG